ncbi:MAG: hypothetical protein SH868_03055 [Bythopirellula sp.]|nr:hypothetical protein [Bythopirellula sp.]
MNARSGYSVGQALQESVQGVNVHLQECLAKMTQLDSSASELVERRGKAFLELAEHYLPAIDQQSVAGTFHEVRSDLMDVLSRKLRHERELKKTLEADAKEKARLDQELERVTKELNEKVITREELEVLVAKRLEGDAEFQRLSREALVAEKELERNEQRVTDIQRDAAEKLPSYEKSQLFQYLHKRGYGTSGYKKEGLTKRLDGWVAKLIDFQRARRGYEFLRVTPELMAHEVARRRDQFNGLMELVEACEDRHGDALGLTAVMREGQELGVARDKLLADIVKQRDLTFEHHQEAKQLEYARNAYYEQAIDRMKAFLAGLEAWRLEHASRSTPETEDDQIVAELTWLGNELEKTKKQSVDLVADREIWKARAVGIQDIWQRFRRADYDSGRSMFHPDFEIEGYLENFVRGQLSRDDLWSAIRSAQQFAPPWHEDPGQGRGRGIETDFSYVLLRVLTEIAGQALRHVAERGMERRGPIRQQQRAEAGRPKFRNRGFTSGRGF